MNKLDALWSWAAEQDRTLRVQQRHVPALRNKHLSAKPYSRRQAFASMESGRIGLFRGLPVPILEDGSGEQRHQILVQGLRTGFPKTETATVQKGIAQTRSRMTIPNLINCWDDGRTLVSVTDLHFRGTRFEKLIDIGGLTDFNILCNDPKFAQEFIDTLEMMTLVVSARGNVTDSHTDDCDGTNHCFLGRKLWLAWDRLEGQRRGLQDTTRDDVHGQATFDMQAFLSIHSARWFLINPNQTLFLPGHLAHKVVTLEHYIGVGSFYVTLPGALRTLARWHLYGTTDIHRKQALGKITLAVIGRIVALRSASQKKKNLWGLRQMQATVRRWDQQENKKTKMLLLSQPGFAPFIEAALAS